MSYITSTLTVCWAHKKVAPIVNVKNSGSPRVSSLAERSSKSQTMLLRGLSYQSGCQSFSSRSRQRNPLVDGSKQSPDQPMQIAWRDVFTWFEDRTGQTTSTIVLRNSLSRRSKGTDKGDGAHPIGRISWLRSDKIGPYAIGHWFDAPNAFSMVE